MLEWDIPLEGTLFSLTDKQACRVFDKSAEMGPLADCANVVLKGQFVIGTLRVVTVAVWDESPDCLSTIYELGPTLLTVWNSLLVRNSIWAEQIDVGYKDLFRELKVERRKIREKSTETEIDMMVQPQPRLEDLEDDIARAVNTWAQEHPEPGTPLLAVGRKAYTPTQIAAEVYNRTVLGRRLRQQIMQSSVDQILQR